MLKQTLHGHGHVILEKHLGGDLDIANSARTSLDNEHAEFDERDAGLIRRLMTDSHGTPFESVVLHFDIKAPIAMIREFQRHRVPWSYSEQSARYKEPMPEFYIPDAEHVREQIGKSMSYTFEPVDTQLAARTQKNMLWAYDTCWEAYREMLEDGIAKEVARFVLPVGMFSRMKVRTNLRAAMNFFSLRNHPAAQQEIREIAAAMEEMTTTVAPVAMAAYKDNQRVAP